MGVGQKREAPMNNKIMNNKRTPEIYSEPKTMKTNMISLLPTKTTSKKREKNQQKCKYYNQGYCKNKDKCFFYHPITECINQCIDKYICPHRHRKECKYGNECYHNKNKLCEFMHEEKELLDDTLATEDEKQNKTHHVILAAPSSLEEDLRQELICLQNMIENIYKKEIANLKI